MPEIEKKEKKLRDLGLDLDPERFPHIEFKDSAAARIYDMSKKQHELTG